MRMSKLIGKSGPLVALSAALLTFFPPAYADSEAGFQAGSEAGNEAPMTPGRHRHRHRRRMMMQGGMGQNGAGNWAGGMNGMQGGSGGHGGHGGHGGNREAKHQKMMQRFDKNGDGVLDDSERQSMQAFKAQRRADRAAMNGPDAGLGSGPGGGGGGKHHHRNWGQGGGSGTSPTGTQ